MRAILRPMRAMSRTILVSVAAAEPEARWATKHLGPTILRQTIPPETMLLRARIPRLIAVKRATKITTTMATAMIQAASTVPILATVAAPLAEMTTGRAIAKAEITRVLRMATMDRRRQAAIAKAIMTMAMVTMAMATIRAE